VDGDGFADVVVGAKHVSDNGVNAGSASVLSGRDGSLLHLLAGDSPQDLFGWSVAGAGDVDGDGFDDLVVGATRDDGGGAEAGSATVLSGLDGAMLSRIFGESPGDLFGWSVAGGADTNSDGVDDLIVGTPYESVDAPFDGTARVFSGLGPVLAYGEGCGGMSARWVNAPAVGATDFLVTGAGAGPGLPAFLVLGASDAIWSGAGLPLDLEAWGAPGCTLLASADMWLASPAGASGGLGQALAVPSDAALVGATVFVQWIVLDSTANPLGLTSSDGLAVTIQP
jgi:hypothetical protein